MGYRLQVIGIILCAAFLFGCQNAPDVHVVTRECAAMPVGRATACACSLNGKGYVFAGREGGRYKNDLWQYDPVTDSWTDLGASPMKPRVNATIAAANGKLYAGLGYAGYGVYRDSTYLQDWWEYTPETGEWRRLADYPNQNTVGPYSTTVGDVIYSLYGMGWGFTQDVCLYHTTDNTWSQLPINAERARYAAGCCGAMLDGVYYFGTGYRTYNETQWFSADLATDKWHRCASIPGKGREVSACAASKNYVYLFGGRYFGGDMSGGEIFDTYMRYLPSKDQWEWCGKMPCGRAENQIAFSINGKVYFGLGENEKGEAINKLYCIEE